jgi:hypothetical protein
MRTGGLPPRACGVAAGVELDPEVRLADPQPRDLENPDVALEALRLDGAEGGLVEIPRPAGIGHCQPRSELGGPGHGIGLVVKRRSIVERTPAGSCSTAGSYVTTKPGPATPKQDHHRHDR